MAKYLVSNVANRKHSKIYGSLGHRAFFDLEPTQHGWKEYSSINVGDLVYVINKNGNVAVGYEVTAISDGVLLSKNQMWGHKVEADMGGASRVLFGTPVERVDTKYSKFCIIQ